MRLEWPHVQQTECILFVFLNKKEAGHFLQKAGPGVKWYFPPESGNVVTYERDIRAQADDYSHFERHKSLSL